jgi:hypothetical protein
VTGTARRPAFPARPPHAAPREEYFHLLVLDPTQTHILVARPLRSWILPHLKFRGPARQLPILTPYLAHFGIDDARPIHEVVLCDGLGSDERPCGPQAGVAHRYVALEARAWRRDDHDDEGHGRLIWEPIQPLLMRPLAMLPVQETAVRTCLQRLAHGDSIPRPA